MKFFIQVHTCCSAHTHTCQKSCREGGAEREGDEEGVRQKRRGGGGGSLWAENGESVDGMIGGGDREKSRGFGRRGVEDDGYSRGREERENGGITRYVNERGWLIKA